MAIDLASKVDKTTYNEKVSELQASISGKADVMIN